MQRPGLLLFLLQWLLSRVRGWDDGGDGGGGGGGDGGGGGGREGGGSRVRIE